MVLKLPLMKFSCIIPIAFLYASATCAQESDFTIVNNQRIQTNTTGMVLLGSWGAVNVAGGLSGYFIASDKEWQAFHGMNAIWGAVNGVIAVGGYIGARKEVGKDFTAETAYERFRSGKRLYLINAGLDVLYIGTGAALTAWAPQSNNNPMWSGFGKSVMLQGVALLIFDGVMYGVHSSNNKKWKKIATGFTFTGNGLGYVYRF